MRMTGFAGHRSYSTRPPRKPYASRKRALVSRYTENPPERSRMSGAVLRCYFHENMTLADTAEILDISVNDVEFLIDCLIQDSQ